MNLPEALTLNHFAYDILLFFAIIAGSILAAFILFRIGRLIYRKTTSLSENLFDQKFKSSFIFLITIIATNFALTFTELPPKVAFVLDKVCYILLVYSVAHLIIKAIEFTKEVLYIKFDIADADNLEERKARTQIDFLQKAGTVLIILIAFAIALMSFNRVRELGTSILASAGLAGVILGFAAQKSIANLLAGLQIAFTQPIRIDDSVLVENQFGKIEEISLTYVVVKLWDERRLILPISYFIDKPFENWTRSSTSMLGTVTIFADYSLPINAIRAELDKLLRTEGQKWWDGRLNLVQVTGSTDRAMEVRILISARNSSDTFDLRCLVREKIINYIQTNYPNSLPKLRYEEFGEKNSEFTKPI